MRRHSYLSCYGPQFIHGLAVVADQVKYRPAAFLKKTLKFPNYFMLVKEPAPRDFRGGDVKTVVWTAVIATWLILALIWFYAQIPLVGWLIFVGCILLIAPFMLIFAAAAVLWLHAAFPR